MDKKEFISRYSESTRIFYDALHAKDPRQKALVDALLEFLVLRHTSENSPTDENIENFMNYFKKLVNNWS